MCDTAPPDKRILDIDGEMVVRDGEIVLTESVDGREPFTITLKKQDALGEHDLSLAHDHHKPF